MNSNASSPESAPTVRAWTFCLLKMSSNAQKAARKITIVPGSASLLIQIYANCFQAAKASKTPSAPIASAGKVNVKTQFQFVLFKAIIFDNSYVIFLGYHWVPFFTQANMSWRLISDGWIILFSSTTNALGYLMPTKASSNFLLILKFLPNIPGLVLFDTSSSLFYKSLLILFAGNCIGNISHIEDNILTKEDCLTACQNFPSCK